LVNFLEVEYDVTIGFDESFATEKLEVKSVAAVEKDEEFTCEVTATRCEDTVLSQGENMKICFTSDNFSTLGCQIVGIQDLSLYSVSTGTSQALISGGDPIGSAAQFYTASQSDELCPVPEGITTSDVECVYLVIDVWGIFSGKTDLQVVGNAILNLKATTARRSVKVNMDRLLQGNQVDGPIDGYISADEWPEQSGAAVIFGAFAALAAAVGAAGFLMI
jgi:hypothetical protein